jgi:hypothetical protein
MVAVLHNVTNDGISYNAGIQEPGIYEFIGVIKSPEMQEHDNSTTETYSVGLSYCGSGIINESGYYTMSSNSLEKLGIFFTTNELCSTAVQIEAKNATINCRGGSINSTNTSILIQNSSNILIENCNLYGNALEISGSTGINVKNTSIIANNRTDTILRSYDSYAISFINDRITGYMNQSLNQINIINSTSYNATAPQNTTQNSSSSQKKPTAGPPSNGLLFIWAILIFLLAFAVFLIIIRLKRGQ